MTIAQTGTQLQVASVTMQGGQIRLENSATHLVLLGTLSATSSAAGPAMIGVSNARPQLVAAHRRRA